MSDNDFRAAGSSPSRRNTVECKVLTRSAARRRAVRRSKCAVAWRERNGVVGQRCGGIDRDQRQIRLAGGDLFGQRIEARLRSCPDIATRTAAGCSCSTARDASAQAVSMTGNILASSSAGANDGRSAVDTTMNRALLGHLKLGIRDALNRANPSLPALMSRQRIGRISISSGSPDREMLPPSVG